MSEAAAARQQAGPTPFTLDEAAVRDELVEMLVLSSEVVDERRAEGQRTALDRLLLDQADLWVEAIAGFRDRSAVLTWMQDVVIHSLGRIGPAEWFAGVLADENLMAALLARPYGGCDGFSPQQVRELREGWTADVLLPAFADAHREFRWSAVEYGSNDSEDWQEAPDPSVQRAPAMRPALATLEERQARALETLLEGFETSTAFAAWGQAVTRASYAELDRALLREAYFDLPVRRRMTAPDDAEARWFREAWAAEYLLPAFNAAATQLSSRANEVAESTSNDLKVPSG